MKTWWEYVSDGLAMNGMTQMSLADDILINRSTVSDWKTNGSQPKSQHAIATARVFGRSVMEALVIAGHVPAEEVDMPALALDPRQLTNSQLSEEMRRRFDRFDSGSRDEAQLDPDRVGSSG